MMGPRLNTPIEVITPRNVINTLGTDSQILHSWKAALSLYKNESRDWA